VPPNGFKEPILAEALEPAMHGAIAAETLGEFVPLAAAAHAKDNAVEHLSQVCWWPTRGLFRVTLIEDWL
jgi:hypothetical protein